MQKKKLSVLLHEVSVLGVNYNESMPCVVFNPTAAAAAAATAGRQSMYDVS